ncbi:helicase, partial [Halorubrum sp. Ea8]
NYDLPWNPTRIDQRIGRLHRYGQDETVEIRNLFFKDTRESIILERLLEKIDEIEETLGMSSDVLGLVLEDVDLEEQIMSALASGESPEQIVDDLEEIVENQEEAVRRVDEDLLIRDKFDLSEEDRDILNIVEESAEDTVSEADVKYLVKTVCQEFGGGLTNVRPGPADDGGDVFDLVVPDQLTGNNVQNRYDGATFDRENALADESLEFITLDHPVVRAMMAYCLDTDAVGGQTAVLTGGETLETPGLLCHYRVGYLSGTGDTVTEQLAQIYVTPDGVTRTEEIDITGGLPPSTVDNHASIRAISSQAEKLVSKAEDVAWDLIDNLAQEARTERERDVRIRREHAEKYFQYRMDDLEERIRQFEKRDRAGEDMSAVLAKHQSQLAELREKKNAEMDRLESEKQVVPDEPELVNMAVVVDAFED